MYISTHILMRSLYFVRKFELFWYSWLILRTLHRFSSEPQTKVVYYIKNEKEKNAFLGEPVFSHLQLVITKKQVSFLFSDNFQFESGITNDSRYCL